MLYSILLVIQVLLAIGLIALVLLQHGKGADAGAAFGSGASSTVFGSRGSTNFLSRSTAIIATLFFLNSLALAYLVGNQPVTGSVVDTLEAPPAVEAPMQEPSEDVPVHEDVGQPSDVPE